jgi:hypothetical protein
MQSEPVVTQNKMFSLLVVLSFELRAEQDVLSLSHRDVLIRPLERHVHRLRLSTAGCFVSCMALRSVDEKRWEGVIAVSSP